jgi:histidinol-phosphate aminotransferase
MLSPKPYLQKINSGIHGGIQIEEMRRFGINPAEVVDFSVSTNPFGPPSGILEVLSKVDFSRYPDSYSGALKNQLAHILKVSNKNLIVGNGSTELIRLVAMAYLGVGDSVLVPQPTYGEYELASRLVGADIIKMVLDEDKEFRLNPTQLLEIISQYRPKVVFLCNPNNPSGDYLSEEVVINILGCIPDSLVVMDEAYINFCRNRWPSEELLNRYDNLVVIRSMTKDYALAGLRLGYATASESVISVLETVKPPWNVGSLAQAAGCFVLNQKSYLDSMREELSQAAEYLKTSLQQRGLRPLPSHANFFLVKVGEAAGFRRALLRKKVLVRDCASFGLPAYIRLAIRKRLDCLRLLEAIDEVGLYNYVI